MGKLRQLGSGTGDAAARSAAPVAGEPAVRAPADPAAVIRQARARQRRRRKRIAAVLAATAVAAGAVLLAVSRNGGAAPAGSAPHAVRPSVDSAAFAGHGELAFVSRGTLWVLDGRTGALRRVPAPGVAPQDPAFSRDGRWLAFVGTSPHDPAASAPDTLWLASGNGSGAHQVRGLAVERLLGWSPARDLLAVTAGPQSAAPPGGLPATVRLVSPSGSVRRLAGPASIESAAWSPDGTSIAVAETSASASELVSYPVMGGRPEQWLRLAADHSMNYLIDPAGWWRGQGIGFWALADSASLSADQVPFYLISGPGASARLLGYTLSGGTGSSVAAAGGRLAIADKPPGSGGRVVWQSSRVEVCGGTAAPCSVIASPRSGVTLDPAWSPDGTMLAFVRAPSRESPAFPQRVVAAWYSAHQLWLYSPASRSLRRLNADGASAPAWSADGRSLLYIAGNGIWLLPRLSGRPARVAGPLFRPGSWPSYYGQVSWAAQFAWWSR